MPKLSAIFRRELFEDDKWPYLQCIPVGCSLETGRVSPFFSSFFSSSFHPARFSPTLPPIFLVFFAEGTLFPYERIQGTHLSSCAEETSFLLARLWWMMKTLSLSPRALNLAIPIKDCAESREFFNRHLLSDHFRLCSTMWHPYAQCPYTFVCFTKFAILYRS